VVGDAP